MCIMTEFSNMHIYLKIVDKDLVFHFLFIFPVGEWDVATVVIYIYIYRERERERERERGREEKISKYIKKFLSWTENFSASLHL